MSMSARCEVIHGDSIDVLRTMEPDSIAACVTDAPYGLSDHSPDDVLACLSAWLRGEEYRPRAKGGFMGRSWDAWVPGPELWREVYRVMKPGAYLACFAGTRTADLMGIAIRLAGFRAIDTVHWAHLQGFPKSMDISKAIDRAAGAEREVIGSATKA
jgi:site-specific DNA-methyltransferase (adenine-specific)